MSSASVCRQCCGSNGAEADRWLRMKIRKTALILTAVMGLSLLAGCDNEKQQILRKQRKIWSRAAYEYALDEIYYFCE